MRGGISANWVSLVESRDMLLGLPNPVVHCEVLLMLLS